MADGLTLNLQKVSASAATVTVASDNTAIKTAINDFVTSYNSLMSLMRDSIEQDLALLMRNAELATSEALAREAQREALLHSRLLAVTGTLQCDRPERMVRAPATGADAPRVRHVIARQLDDLSPWLGRLAQSGTRSRDFR
mgnify:CR=1 FL=1